MGTKQRSKIPSLRQDLYKYPYKYEFHQAAYLLENIFKKTHSPIGEGLDSDEETVKIKSRVSLSAPAGDIFSFNETRKIKTPPTMNVNFWGLAGIQGPLPQPYTEMVADRIRDHDYAMQDFLDIFNHRLISLLHRIKKKSIPCLNTQEPHNSPKGISLRSLMGFRNQEMEKTLGLNPTAMISFSSLFWQHPRSSIGLKVILEKFFKTKISIKQYQGGWMSLDEDQTSLIGLSGRFNKLGYDSSLGSRSWRAEKNILIIMGPLNRDLFNQCIKSGSLYSTLVRLIKFYLPSNIGFKIQLILEGDKLSKTYLDNKSELSATSWIISSKHKKLQDDQVFLTPQKKIFEIDFEKKS